MYTELQSGRMPTSDELPWSAVVSKGSTTADRRQMPSDVQLKIDGQDLIGKYPFSIIDHKFNGRDHFTMP
jgi:hypothetical protein